MASVTLAESAKLTQNELVAGVIENVITTNQMFQILPFDSFSGNALAYNRENALGSAAVAGVGSDLSGASYKAAATFNQVSTSLTKIIGDAEVDNLIRVTRSDGGTDQEAIQVASKAKFIGREFQRMMISGSGASNEFSGLATLTPSGQTVSAGTNGGALSFTLLDELTDNVIDKDGMVDYIVMNNRSLRQYRVLLRALGGASITEVYTLPNGSTVQAYSGYPVFRNDWIPSDEVQGTATTTSSVYAGTLDDGSRSYGIAGLTSEIESGIQVVPVGESENKDERITRVRWYCSLALFNEKGISRLKGLTA